MMRVGDCSTLKRMWSRGLEWLLRSWWAKHGEERERWERMNKLVQFVKESYAELRKVVWPSRDDVVSSVKVVILSTVIIAAALGLVDVLLLFGIRVIF
jgi:preprotein translocase subunit SecE